jgi:hypothetical protein
MGWTLSLNDGVRENSVKSVSKPFKKWPSGKSKITWKNYVKTGSVI